MRQILWQLTEKTQIQRFEFYNQCFYELYPNKFARGCDRHFHFEVWIVDENWEIFRNSIAGELAKMQDGRQTKQIAILRINGQRQKKVSLIGFRFPTFSLFQNFAGFSFLILSAARATHQIYSLQNWLKFLNFSQLEVKQRVEGNMFENHAAHAGIAGFQIFDFF